MSEQHEWTPGKTFYLSCGICGVDSKFHKESNKWLTGEALQDYDKVIHVGGRGFGKTKMVEDIMKNIEQKKEIFNDFETLIDDSRVPYYSQEGFFNTYKFDKETGILTAEYIGEDGERTETKKFRLVEVRD